MEKTLISRAPVVHLPLKARRYFDGQMGYAGRFQRRHFFGQLRHVRTERTVYIADADDAIGFYRRDKCLLRILAALLYFFFDLIYFLLTGHCSLALHKLELVHGRRAPERLSYALPGIGLWRV